MGQILFLRLQKVFQKCSRRDHAAVIISKPQAFQCSHMEMIFQRTRADLIIKIPGVQRIDGDPQLFFQKIQIHPAHIKSLIAYQL